MENKNYKKVNLTSSNLGAETLDKLRKIIPDVFLENKIDWDKLSAVLGYKVDDRVEKFGFTWAGKIEAIKNALIPSKATLKPAKEEGVKFDESKNIFIEGDNLEVLKLLQRAYFEKIKMIYIDPPYNTGGDFVYKDNFAAPLKGYLEQTGQVDGDGNKLQANRETNGRYHSDWLSMMYPRLKLAWNLLRDDGVIFISIDDNEVHHLRMLMDEIFGEESFVGQITREQIKGGSQSSSIRIVHDYILIYAKNIGETNFSGYEREGIKLNLSDEKGAYAKGRELNKWGAASRREDSPSMYFPIPGPNGEEVYPIRNDGSQGRWRLGKKKMMEKATDGDIIFEKREDGSYIAYEKIRDDSPKITQFTTIFRDKYINAKGTELLKSLFDVERAYFDYSKPVELIKDLMVLADVNNSDIVLDFFAGSGTTAHAVMELNTEDGEKRKWINVQLPEKVAENSEAEKAGYKTIADITKKRIILAINFLQDELSHNRALRNFNKDTGMIGKDEEMETLCDFDNGFKVFKLDKSNYWENGFDFDPERSEEENKKAFLAYLNRAKQAKLFEKTQEVDVVYENIIKEGLSLNAKIEEQKIAGAEIYKVIDGEKQLLICLENKVSPEAVNEFRKVEYKGKIFICLDNALDDTAKANLGLNVELKTI